MNANVTKTNGVKLFALVAVLAMVFAGAAVLLSDTADAASGSTNISGTISEEDQQVYGQNSSVVINDDLTIPDGTKLDFSGKLVVNPDVTVTVEEGGQLIFRNSADVTIDGTVEIEGYDGSTNPFVNNATYVEKKSGVVVNGSIILEESKITAGSQNPGEILIANGGSFELGGSDITNQKIILDNNATFVFEGTTNDKGVEIVPKVSGNYYSMGSARITNTNAGGADFGDDISDITFTVSSKNISGYTWDNINEKAVATTIKQFTLNISGTVDNKDVLSLDGSVWNNTSTTASEVVTNYYTSADYAKAYNGITLTSGNYMYDSIVDGKIAVSNLNIENGASFINSSAYVTVDGKMTVADESKKDANDFAKAKNQGVIEVVGSVDMNYSSFVKNDSHPGTIAINGGTVTIADGVAGGTFLYGALYIDNDDVMHISSLESAISGAVSAEVDEVTVYGMYNTNELKVGSYLISSDITIPDDMELVIVGGLVVDEGVTMTISADSKVKFEPSDGNSTSMLYVDGKVIDNSRELEDAEADEMTFQVKIVTGEGRNVINTYTSFAIALAETTSGTIYLYDNVDIEGTVTIPENVTVQYADDLTTPKSEADITLKDNATLNVNGTLIVVGDHQLVATADGSRVNVNNVIKTGESDSTQANSNIDGALAGAYFTAELEDDDEPYDYITSVAYAAGVSGTLTDSPVIDIKNGATIGTVTFTAAEDEKLTINVINNAETGGNQKSTGAVTLIGNIVFDMTEGMYDGTITADVTAGTTTVDFDNSIDAIISLESEETVESVITDFVIKSEGEIDGTVTVSAGTVLMPENIWFKKLVIASGATVDVEAELNTAINPGFKSNTILRELPLITEELIDNLAGLVVEGTLNIGEKATLDSWVATVDGTLNILENANTSVIRYSYINGTLNIDETVTAEYLIMFVTGTVNGSVDAAKQALSGGGEVIIGGIVAFPGSDLTAAKINYFGNEESEAENTTYYINGNEYATVYATDGNVDILAILLAMNAQGCAEDTAVFYSDAEMTQVIGANDGTPSTAVGKIVAAVEAINITNNDDFLAGLSNIGRTAFPGTYHVGDFESVYVGMEASEVIGTITVYQGMDLYIDGKAITNFYQEGKGYVLPVGQHTFSVQIDPGLTGTYEVTLDGQAVNGTFTIADNAKEFQIVVTGNLTQESVVVDQGGSSDSGMGLTDYLLIILVILIVVMAIIVAMRLMRS